MNEPSPTSSRPDTAKGERSFREREGSLHLIADWMEPVFLHYRIDPARLREQVPYELDLWAGRAWVSLVAFTMRDLRPSLGGWWSRWPFFLFREQRFLNVRTYVRHGGERGIHFLAEWISDWVNAKLGPLWYGLPYRHGRLAFRRDGEDVNGIVREGGECFQFRGRVTGKIGRCDGGLESFLLERYSAFNSAQGRKRLFRVWHEPWKRQPAAIEVLADTLLRRQFHWWADAELALAQVSAGAFGVRMGRPRKVDA